MTITPYALQRYLAEFIGTLLLVLVGVGSAVISGPLIGPIGIALAFGITLMVLASVIGPISGCHINPAVTLGFFVSRRFEARHVIPYWLAQFAGAIVGAWLVYLLATGKVGFELADGFACNGYGPYSPQNYPFFSAMMVEVIITGLLVFVVLGATRPNFPAVGAPFIIGGTLIVVHFMSIPITNTSANLARSLATAVFVQGWALEQLLYFAMAHFIAAIVAVIAYKAVFPAH